MKNNAPVKMPGRNKTILLAVASALGAATSANATVDFSPYVGAEIQHTSNLFSRPESLPPFAASGDDTLGDTIYQYFAGLNSAFLYGDQKFSVIAQGRRLEYDHFTLLDHTDYRGEVRYDWKLNSIVDGALSVSRTRAMTPPADTLAAGLNLNTEQREEVLVRVLVTPRWRVDLNLVDRDSDSPLPDFPDFTLNEKSGMVSFNYLGFSKLTAGLRFQYIDGKYDGVATASDYTQKSVEGTADYAVTSLSSFNGALGYTRRESSADGGGITPQFGSTGATDSITGSLGATRRLTGKTSVSARLFRSINSFIGGPNPETDTGGEASVTWRPDVKLSFVLLYRQMKSSIDGSSPSGVGTLTDRADHVHAYSLEAVYEPGRHLTLRPYVRPGRAHVQLFGGRVQRYAIWAGAELASSVVEIGVPRSLARRA
ncbi:MAG: hypothetical protein WDO56_21595 [Gammaproteobacteria bacterium]